MNVRADDAGAISTRLEPKTSLESEMVQKALEIAKIRPCVDCGVAIPPHPGSGRPRLRCELCAHPLSNRDYWHEVQRATHHAPGYPGSPEFEAFMAPIYARLGGQRSASRKPRLREVGP
jgi:hypothetical protein